MKIVIDKILSAILLIIFFPLLILVPIIIFVYDLNNPFYTPERVGKNKKNFKIIKFRSMVINADKNKVDSTKRDDNRITPIGKFIRKFKLDEISQILNVVIGNMSLVGPRPNVFREVKMYSNLEMQILSVKPGITDISSLVFADEGDILHKSDDPDLKYNQIIRPWKSRLAILYVKKNTILIDFYILFLTFLSFINRPLTLKLLSKLVYNLSNDEKLSEVCLRNKPLETIPPPGLDKVVQKRF